MGMHAFRRLREQEAAAAALSEAIAASPSEDTIEPGTFDQHPPKKRRTSRRSAATPTEN